MPDVEGELRARAAADGVEFFFALFVDMHGRPCAKMVPVEALGVMLGGGSGFAGFAAGPMGQSPADPDMIAVPDVARRLCELRRAGRNLDVARLLGQGRVEAIRLAARGANGDVAAVRRRLPFTAPLAEIRLALEA